MIRIETVNMKHNCYGDGICHPIVEQREKEHFANVQHYTCIGCDSEIILENYAINKHGIQYFTNHRLLRPVLNKIDSYEYWLRRIPYNSARIYGSSYVICGDCGNDMPVQNEGHIKKTYCNYCDKGTHSECYIILSDKAKYTIQQLNRKFRKLHIDDDNDIDNDDVMHVDND